jgi:hypothetical protein
MALYIIQSLRDEWRNNSLLVCVEIIGTGVSIIAALVLSLNLMNIWIVYWLWLIGSVSLTLSSWWRKNLLLLLLMIYYTILNMLGLWNFS